MCVEVTTKWPCGHKKSHYEFCESAKPKKRIVFFRLAKPSGDRPLEPCAEQTKQSVHAPADSLCDELRCKDRISWMCCKCPALPEAEACSVNMAAKTGKTDRAPYAVMSREVLGMLNAGFSCGTSQTGSADCGHQRCTNCLAWRRCRCGCHCRNMTPLSRHVCRPCLYSTCRGKAQRKDKTAEALDIALANLRERTKTMKLGQKKVEATELEDDE